VPEPHGRALASRRIPGAEKDVTPTAAAMTEVDTDQGAYREGLFVRALGRPCSSNPYPPNSGEGVLWEKGWRLIDACRESVPSTDAALPPVRPVPEFTPSVASANSGENHREQPIAGFSSRNRLVDVAIVLAFIAMLIGMWMVTMR
jgi:hypothetical protein